MTAADFSFLITKAGTVVENPTVENAAPQTSKSGGQNEALFHTGRDQERDDLRILVCRLREKRLSKAVAEPLDSLGFDLQLLEVKATRCRQCQGWHTWAAVVKPGFLKDVASRSVSSEECHHGLWLNIIQPLFFSYPPICTQTLTHSLQSLHGVAAQFLFFL